MQHTVYLFDGFQLDVTRRKLISSGGIVLTLNSRAMEALLLLVENSGRLVEKRRLMQTVWPNAIVEDNNLNQCVLAIRKALGETAGSNRYIMTVPGRGYRFVCPVRELAQESPADTATVPTQPRRPRLLWLGAAGALCLPVLALLALRMAERPQTSGMAVELSAGEASPDPAIILSLRESTAGHGIAAGGSTEALAQCLEARPDMKLLVQVQLLADDGEQVWAGSYIAGVRHLHAPRIDSGDSYTSCRELVATAQPGRQPSGAQ